MIRYIRIYIRYLALLIFFYLYMLIYQYIDIVCNHISYIM